MSFSQSPSSAPASFTLEFRGDFLDPDENPFIDLETYLDAPYRTLPPENTIFKSPRRLDPVLSQPLFAFNASQSSFSCASNDTAVSISCHITPPKLESPHFSSYPNLIPADMSAWSSPAPGRNMLLFSVSPSVVFDMPSEASAECCSDKSSPKLVRKSNPDSILCQSILPDHDTLFRSPLIKEQPPTTESLAQKNTYSPASFGRPSQNVSHQSDNTLSGVKHTGSVTLLASPFEYKDPRNSITQKRSSSSTEVLDIPKRAILCDISRSPSNSRKKFLKSLLYENIQSLSPLSDISSCSSDTTEKTGVHSPSAADGPPRVTTRAQLKRIGLSQASSGSQIAHALPPLPKRRKHLQNTSLIPVKRRRIANNVKRQPRLPSPTAHIKFTSTNDFQAQNFSDSALKLRKFPPNVPINPDFMRFYKPFPVSSYFFDAEGKLILLDRFVNSFICFYYYLYIFSSRPTLKKEATNPPRDAFDLYTPRFTKGVGRTKLGLCPICIEPRERGGADRCEWLNMKTSAYK